MPSMTVTQSHAVAQKVATASADDVETLKNYFKKEDFNYIVETLEAVESKSPEQHNMLISALMNIDLDDAEEAAEQFIEDYSDNYKE